MARRAFAEAFGLELLEGYGCTEMSPVVAVNGPGYEAGRESQTGTKPGTVGHLLPGVAAKIVDVENLQLLGPNQEGLLMVKGPNRMLGYWNDPEGTAAAIDDGWYRTGDLAVIDEDGFLRITDRLSRFSKFGGAGINESAVK
jgi:acyl-[acyl-carrier-protein]-phospholipid O-acyltransferase/long-chain-fatty-acid--[acyl-carrier-protein] ligase